MRRSRQALYVKVYIKEGGPSCLLDKLMVRKLRPSKRISSQEVTKNNVNSYNFNAVSCKFKGVYDKIENKKYSYNTFDIDNYMKDKTLDDKDFKDAFLSFVEQNIGKTVLDIPEYIDDFLVDRIPQMGLAGRAFEVINFPSTLKMILNNACYQMPNLNKVIIPEGVVVIEKSAFAKCMSLKEVYLSETLEYIGNYAFDECKELRYVKMPSKMSTIRAYAFSGTGLESITVPEISFLGNSCFYECKNLSEVNFVGPVKTIGSCAFQDCSKLRRIELPDGLENILMNAFGNCTSLVTVTMPKTLKSINEFEYMGIKKEINSFNNCNSMVAVIINSQDIYKKEFTYGKEKFVFPVMPIFMNFRDSEKGKDRYFIIKEHVDKASISENKRIENYVYYGNKEKAKGYIGNAIRLYIDALSLKGRNGVVQYNLAKALYLSGNIEGAIKGLLFAINNVGIKKNNDIYGLYNKFFNGDTDSKFMKWLRDPMDCNYSIDITNGGEEGKQRLINEVLQNCMKDVVRFGLSGYEVRRNLEYNLNYLKNPHEIGLYDEEEMTMPVNKSVLDNSLYPEDYVMEEKNNMFISYNAEVKKKDEQFSSKEKVIKKIDDNNSIEIEYHADNSFNMKFDGTTIMDDPRKLEKMLTEALCEDNIKSMKLDKALSICNNVEPSKAEHEDDEYERLSLEYEKRMYKKALDEYNAAKDNYGKLEKVVKLVDLGVSAKRAQCYAEAINYYIAALDIDPNASNVYYALGKATHLMGKYDQSVRAYALAFINNCRNNISDIYKHCGYSFIANLPFFAEKYKNDIKEYSKSINGFSFSFSTNIQLDNACEVIGKAVIEIMKQEYENLIARS